MPEFTLVDLQQISDRLEIQDVLVRYTRAIDAGEWDKLDTVFTPDAEIDYVASGGIKDTFPTIKAWLAEVLPAFFPTRLHMLGQFDIAIEGDEATCTAYFYNPMTMPDPATAGATKVAEVGGLYHHTLIRTAEGWRSRKLVEEVAWKRGM